MPTELEIKAIAAMAKIFENKFTLQPDGWVIHEAGYMTKFLLSNGDEYLVKVYDDTSEPKIYKLQS